MRLGEGEGVAIYTFPGTVSELKNGYKQASWWRASQCQLCSWRRCRQPACPAAPPSCHACFPSLCTCYPHIKQALDELAREQLSEQEIEMLVKVRRPARGWVWLARR